MHNRQFVFQPMPDQSLGIMQPMNPMQQPDAPIVSSLVPSDWSTPVEDLAPYGPSQEIAGVGSVQDAMNVLTITDLLFGG